MWQKETKSKCCIDYEPLPADIQHIAPHICQDFARLSRLHRRAFVRNRRIIELAKAKPSSRVHRFVNRCPCFLKKHVQIIRLDQRLPTRTEQLAYPKARHLFLFKQQIRKLFPSDRIINLNRLIRKSLFSLYSRLGNVQPPLQIKPVAKWSKSEWEKHSKILRKLAKHKEVKIPPEKPGKKKPLHRLKRYKYLAKPKKCLLIEKAGWILTLEMRTHRATERINNLAKPLQRRTSMLQQELPIAIPLRVLKHKASERISALAKPSTRRTGKSDSGEFKENPFAVSPNALKTKASKRTKELAEPREHEEKHIRKDPYAISKLALKAKAKPRTIELAKPRKR